MSFANLVEALGVVRIRFLPMVGREPKKGALAVMAVALEVLDKLARVEVVVLEEVHRPHYLR